MFISSGILFNHESPRRGINFVTNKVVLEAVKIKMGLSNELVLGNLNAMRDWGHAKDYVQGMWLMLQQETPDDYVLATGISKSVRELVEYVFDKLELDSTKYVKSNDKFQRAEELHFLQGDATKAKEKLGWKPTYTFETMLDEMIEYWMETLKTKN
jgi:GDPmannose 4,6-dehydratase